jgi:ABC-type phosphate transport system substrate-binding protein
MALHQALYRGAVPGLGPVLQACDTIAIRLAGRGSRLGAVKINRNAGAALAACAASLSLVACSAGITSASTATTAATASSSSSHGATASSTSSSAPAGRMLSVSGKVSSFPVPAGAKVAENVSFNKDISIMFSKVTLAEVASFYAQALPQAGYTITSNSSASGSGGVVLIQFTGHGYKGGVSALAKVPDPSDTLPGVGTKNVTTILLQPK